MDLPLVSKQLPTFCPGDLVPEKGLYWVIHHRHRAPHVCRLARPRFPQCLKCGKKVTFRQLVFEGYTAAKELRSDCDFRSDPNPHIRKKQHERYRESRSR